MTENRTSKSTIRFGRFSVAVPGTKLQRTVLGIALCVGGVLGFLPVLGFWMLPLGVLVLSIEYHPIRRYRRRFEVWCGRRKGKTKRTAEKRRGPNDCSAPKALGNGGVSSREDGGTLPHQG
jgi:hypothetical protein